MNKDILLVIETVANEKNVSKDIIVDAMEHALAGAVKKKYRLEEKKDIEARVTIDLSTGDYTTYRRWQVVHEIEEDKDDSQILIDNEIVRDNNLKIEDWYETEGFSLEEITITEEKE